MPVGIYDILSGTFADFSETAENLWDRRWAEANAGNISKNITDIIGSSELDAFDSFEVSFEKKYQSLPGEIFLISGSGSRMRHLAKEPAANLCLLKISSSGRMGKVFVQKGNDLKPTSELPSHLAVHNMIKEKKRSETTIVHSHVTEMIALTQMKEIKDEGSLNKLLSHIHPEVMLLLPEGVGFVPYELTGSEQMGEKTIKALKKHRIAVWEKHGAIAIGKSANDAFDLLDTIAKSAEIYFKCKCAGFEPEGITGAQLEEIRRKRL